MAMSSGKSSSMAAVLLLVAVVAGTCTSGAQAQNSFNISNLCNKTIVITTDTGASTLPPGGGLQVDVPPNVFFTGSATFTVTSTGTPPMTVTIQIPQFVLNLLNQLGVQLQKIEIRCEGNCFTMSVTYKPPVLPNPVTMTLGPFCP